MFKRIRLAAVLLAAVGLATVTNPALARPGIYHFHGYYDVSVEKCTSFMYSACASQFGQCMQADGEVYYVDDYFNISLYCSWFPELNTSLFSVSGAAEHTHDDPLFDIINRLQAFVNGNK